MGEPSIPSIVPARMLNEYAYCPRLAYLEWVQWEWADSADTLEGKHAHRKVEELEPSRPRVHNRSVQLTSEKLGVTAVVDIIETDGLRARPVDYKKGRKPGVSEGAYEPDRVQLCVQGLLLREHGYRCNGGGDLLRGLPSAGPRSVQTGACVADPGAGRGAVAPLRIGSDSPVDRGPRRARFTIDPAADRQR